MTQISSLKSITISHTYTCEKHPHTQDSTRHPKRIRFYLKKTNILQKRKLRITEIFKDLFSIIPIHNKKLMKKNKKIKKSIICKDNLILGKKNSNGSIPSYH